MEATLNACTEMRQVGGKTLHIAFESIAFSRVAKIEDFTFKAREVNMRLNKEVNRFKLFQISPSTSTSIIHSSP
jgi:hypothetical protein